MSVVVACGVRSACVSPHTRLRLSVPMLMMSMRTPGKCERVCRTNEKANVLSAAVDVSVVRLQAKRRRKLDGPHRARAAENSNVEISRQAGTHHHDSTLRAVH